MKAINSKSFLNQSLLYAIGEIIPRLISFILLPLYTYYLSPADYGIISYTNAVMMFLFVLGALSLNSYVLRVYFEKKDEKQKNELIVSVFLFIGIVNTILFCVCYFVFPVIITTYAIQVPWYPYFFLAFIINLLDSFSLIPLVMYRVKQNARVFVTISLGKTILQFILTYLFIVVLHKGLIGHFLGKLYSSLPFFIIYICVIWRTTKFRFKISIIKEGLTFSLPLLPGAISYLALGFSDRLILERYVSMDDLGVYNVAYLFSFALNIIIRSGYQALEPEFYKRISQPGFNGFVMRTKKIIMILVFMLAILLTVFSQEIFVIMASKSFYNGYRLIPIIIIGAIFSGLNVIYGTIHTAFMKTKLLGFSILIGAIINLIANLVLVPIYGIYGSGIASAIGFLAINIILFSKLQKQFRNFFPELISLALFVFIAYILFYVIDIQIGVVSFISKVFVCIIFMFTLLSVFKIKIKDILNVRKV